MYKVGEQLVHPGAGACVVSEVSEKMMCQSETKMYYTLHPVQGQGTTWMIPVENAEKIGLRKVMSDKDADTLLKAFVVMPSRWIADRNERTKHYSQLFKDSSVEGMHILMKTFKMLLIREPKGKLPFDDKEMLRKLEMKIISELCTVKKCSFDAMADVVRSMVPEPEEAIAI